MNIRSQKGFSLPELLVGMVIFVIIATAVSGVLFAGIKSFQYNFSQGQDLQKARLAINQIADTVRYASNITTPSIGNTSNQLAFTVAADTYIINVGPTGTYQNAILIFKDGSSTPTTILAPNMISNSSNISFHYYLQNNIKNLDITMTLNDSSYKTSPNMTLNSKVILPNL
jgi:prepilin-type N-terminal cleavage/methylation domain-containing protein